MDNNYYELKMYSLVLYQLDGIHKGIQTQHAITEYGQAHPENLEYKQWANKDKTTIILSAGGSIELIDAIEQLVANDITYAIFKEEDLYDKPTAVCFLVDERVWDKKKWPDPSTYFMPSNTMGTLVPTRSYENFHEEIGGNKNIFLRSFLPNYRRA